MLALSCQIVHRPQMAFKVANIIWPGGPTSSGSGGASPTCLCEWHSNEVAAGGVVVGGGTAHREHKCDNFLIIFS